MNHSLLSPPDVPEPIDASAGGRFVEFACQAPGALSVCLVGDFNGWQPAAHPMQRRSGDRWTVRLELPPGSHQYVFLVDGRPSLIQTSGNDLRPPADAGNPADSSFAGASRRQSP